MGTPIHTIVTAKAKLGPKFQVYTFVCLTAWPYWTWELYSNEHIDYLTWNTCWFYFIVWFVHKASSKTWKHGVEHAIACKTKYFRYQPVVIIHDNFTSQLLVKVKVFSEQILSQRFLPPLDWDTEKPGYNSSWWKSTFRQFSIKNLDFEASLWN